MFGCIVAGRLVQTNIEQIDATHFVFNLDDGGSINHIVVFLLPTNPFPDGFGATVHFQWEDKPFQLLGALTNMKPSAIFRLGGGNYKQNVTVRIGISVEAIEEVERQIGLSVSQQTVGIRAGTIAERTVRNLYNYVSSFATQHPDGAVCVPLRVLKDWHDKFVAKLQTDPKFIEREND